jgi:hypothetical protein
VKSLYVAAALALAACHPPPSSAQATEVAAKAAPVAQPAPAALFLDASGAQVALANVWKAHPQTVLVFYRGFY